MPTILELLKQSLSLYRQLFSLVIGYIGWLLVPALALTFLEHLPSSPLVTLGVFSLATFLLILSLWIFVILARIIHSSLTDTTIAQEELTTNVAPIVGHLAGLTLWLIVIIGGGLILLVIPGLIFSIWFAFAQYAVILDEKRGIQALSYSRSLTKGRFFSVAGKLVGGSIVIIGCYMAVLLLVSSIGAVISSTPVLISAETTPLWLDILDLVGTLFIVVPFGWLYGISLYKALKDHPVSPTHP